LFSYTVEKKRNLFKVPQLLNKSQVRLKQLLAWVEYELYAEEVGVRPQTAQRGGAR
jgi:hypothetical protein